MGWREYTVTALRFSPLIIYLVVRFLLGVICVILCTQGLKGVTAKLCILEEAALLDIGVFYEVVMPLLGVIGTALIGISTAKNEDNLYSELVNMKDQHGNSFFNVIHLSLVCKDCQSAGFDGQTCPHNAYLLPPWKAQDLQDRLMKIMEKHQDLFKTEALGLIIANENSAFSKDDIKRYEFFYITLLDIFKKTYIEHNKQSNNQSIYIHIQVRAKRTIQMF